MKKSLMAVTALLLTLTACGTAREEIQPAEELTTVTENLSATETTETETQEETTEPTTEAEYQSAYILSYAEVYEHTISFVWALDSVAAGEMALQSSADNIDFETVAVLQAEEETYDYEITDDFEIRYFKLIQEQPDGSCRESITMFVRKNEEGEYYADIPDTDGDGLNDMLEIMFQTDIDNPDTDGDGLTDYEEIFLCGTDPTVYDSVTKGISDGDADSDEDGLSNAEEIAAGTNPCEADSDDDGLTDYEEVYTYKTDPLDPDTDGDGIDDGIEIRVALDPLNPATHGTPDAKYQVKLVYTADDSIFYYFNGDDSPYRMSLEIEGTAMAAASVYMSKSGYSNVMENESVLGMIPEITAAEEEGISKIKLMFEIAEPYRKNILNRYPDEPEMQGLKRLNIFHYFEDTNMALPIDTEYDLENHIVYAEVDEAGTYCLVDLEIWLAQIEDVVNDPRLQN